MVDGLFASVRHGNATVAGVKSCCVVGLEVTGVAILTGALSVVPCPDAAMQSAKTAKKGFNGCSLSRKLLHCP